MGLLLIADALVVLMTAGLGFFYVGLLCDTYITNIMMMRVVPMGILPLTCVLSGFLWTLGTMTMSESDLPRQKRADSTEKINGHGPYLRIFWDTLEVRIHNPSDYIALSFFSGHFPNFDFCWMPPVSHRCFPMAKAHYP